MFNPEDLSDKELQEKTGAVKEREDFEKVQGFVKYANKVFDKKYGLSVQSDELPRVVKGSGLDPTFGEKNENLLGEEVDVIKIKDVNQIAEGSTLGEEMSHFYRSHFRSDHSERNTDEFFGWLGRRLLFEATQKEDGTSIFFPKGEPKIDRSVKSQVIERTKTTKKEIRKITDKFTEGELGIQEVSEKRRPLVKARERDTHHFRGYEYASKVDLDRISDWQKLYSMPDKEVRKRFFTDKPDYSGLESVSKTDNTLNAGESEERKTEEIAGLKFELEQTYETGKVWNVLSRYYYEWGKSIDLNDLKNIKKYQEWSKPVNHFLRGKELPERATEEDRANIGSIIETLDKTMANCPKTPVEFTAYRAISGNMPIEEARALIGKNISLDKGYMSTSTSRNLVINDFLQRSENQILYEITVPRGERGVWIPSIINFKEAASRESEFLLPRNSRFFATDVEEQWFINRRSRNAEDVHNYSEERQSPPQFKEKRLVIKLRLENENVEDKPFDREQEKNEQQKEPKKSWLSRLFGR
ncbi:MAG: hypothetical protein A2402_01230 [Candidatus Staskawiczbacteria bacterium RIFOXYC1_FULL_37_43]|nr:MAG: hypothetical protein A2813_02725 [Candidatus Staskawiczbacteria bacterium RIFCSPHIGHO2_01_FULL_37_17]OGZ71682.1 MAG: hypothetical protein A2891_00020 [Candidatus Staskawiczbacteria bacterium RIFCSPLOWO2_01_FULL_37_19]OGZ75376.1 MAG: hypothetical protein A2205_01370 [Candidatus Staskawiczbacteria bacterium RIFOXYA1_FULL_37_15]OGZ76910.1 MAG: hypothetical protein A2280_03820 [Candidatus Staskawiczbacteria bacterium RIFOXYA12_FULL_37_10]OGZ80826.1 MAG: hypothetical protein A2353_01135 [Can